MKIRTYLFLFLLLLFAGGISACNLLQTPTPLPMATAQVPPISEVDQAIQKWSNGHNTRYFAVVEEDTSKGNFQYRIVIADGQVRAAQSLEQINGEWQPPTAFPH